ncbi:hypothetical protein K466DRAFT_614661 [Polyporus arcularius HHB13444]|uniref:ribonuclease H n=1 Tax=Polyporus arcularius HHB13444 TaxID=1314778 RepID=A0A5C3NP27_9APHY|nr:hypothetical protein K466DRAFT_614661 [Polyporus arcularius HHB13444]
MQSNQTAELFAVAVAAAIVPPFTNLHIVTDSRYVLDGLAKHLPKWEANGWYGTTNAELIRDVVARLRARSAPTTIRWTKGHAGDTGNEGADALAKQGSQETRTEPLPPAPAQYLRQGAKLATLTQKLAYKAIRAGKRKPERPATDNMVARIQATLAQDTKREPTAAKIWAAIRHRDIARKMRDFLWKATHDALRVGRYWEHIPGYEQRALCGVCGVTDSLEHILLECDAPGQRTVWKLTKNLLLHRGAGQLQLSLGVLIGAPGLSMAELKGKRMPGLDRLCRIVLTESTHLVWKLRCERVIQRDNDPEQWHTEKEVAGRWRKAVLRRYALDNLLTHRRFGKKGTRANKLEATWGDIFRDCTEDTVPRSGVLVGMTDETGVG